MKEQHLSLFDPSGQEILAQEAKGRTLQIATKGIDIVLKRISKYIRHRRNTSETRFSEGVQNDWYILIGEHARILGNKSEFPMLVRQMGYTAPESFLLKTDKVPPNQRAREVLDYYQNPQRKAEGTQVTKFFVKPLNGSWQRDLRQFDVDSEEGKIALGEYLSKLKEYTLVQEFMPHEKTLRYIRYKSKKGEVYVACFEYVEDESENRKNINIPKIGNKLRSRVMGVNLNEFLTSTANTFAIPLGNSNNQLNNLNKFMDRFVEALEKNLGGSVPFLSTDIGIRELQKLEGNYDDEKMKKNVIFIETQTLPDIWEIQEHSIPHPIRTYKNMWLAFIKDHENGIFARAKDVLRQK